MRAPETLFLLGFSVFALLLWFVIAGAQPLLNWWQADTTWLWASRLAAAATIFGTFLVVAFGLPQLRFLLAEQKRISDALHQQPRLEVGLVGLTEDARQVHPSLSLTRGAQSSHRIEFRVVLWNAGERSAHNVNWTISVDPLLQGWGLRGDVEAYQRMSPQGGHWFNGNIDHLHPTQRSPATVFVDVPADLTSFDVNVRISMDDARPRVWRLPVQVLPPGAAPARPETR